MSPEGENNEIEGTFNPDEEGGDRLWDLNQKPETLYDISSDLPFTDIGQAFAAGEVPAGFMNTGEEGAEDEGEASGVAPGKLHRAIGSDDDDEYDEEVEPGADTLQSENDELESALKHSIAFVAAEDEADAGTDTHEPGDDPRRTLRDLEDEPTQAIPVVKEAPQQAAAPGEPEQFGEGDISNATTFIGIGNNETKKELEGIDNKLIEKALEKGCKAVGLPEEGKDYNYSLVAHMIKEYLGLEGAELNEFINRNKREREADFGKDIMGKEALYSANIGTFNGLLKDHRRKFKVPRDVFREFFERIVTSDSIHSQCDLKQTGNVLGFMDYEEEDLINFLAEYWYFVDTEFDPRKEFVSSMFNRPLEDIDNGDDSIGMLALDSTSEEETNLQMKPLKECKITERKYRFLSKLREQRRQVKFNRRNIMCLIGFVQEYLEKLSDSKVAKNDSDTKRLMRDNKRRFGKPGDVSDRLPIQTPVLAVPQASNNKSRNIVLGSVLAVVTMLIGYATINRKDIFNLFSSKSPDPTPTASSDPDPDLIQDPGITPDPPDPEEPEHALREISRVASSFSPDLKNKVRDLQDILNKAQTTIQELEDWKREAELSSPLNSEEQEVYDTRVTRFTNQAEGIRKSDEASTLLSSLISDPNPETLQSLIDLIESQKVLLPQIIQDLEGIVEALKEWKREAELSSPLNSEERREYDRRMAKHEGQAEKLRALLGIYELMLSDLNAGKETH